MTGPSVRPLSRKTMTTVERVTLDLMHLAAGRSDLSQNPADHDSWCARTVDPEVACTCTRSPLFQDGR